MRNLRSYYSASISEFLRQSSSDDDQTRKREWYDGIYGYLKKIGINEI